MAAAPRVTLEQWRALVGVVEAGGHAQAAEALHKSQSAVTHAIQQLQVQLGVQAFEIRGRKAVLTAPGQLLYRRAKSILEEAVGLERAAQRVSAGWEAEIAIAMEIIYPTWLMLDALGRFGEESPHTHIEVFETVIGGTREALEEGRVDLAVTPHVPPGFESEPLMRLRAIAVASPKHALFAHKGKLTLRELRRHRHIVVRDTSAKRDRTTTVQAEQRWTVGHTATSILAVARGHGFAWFPEDKIRDEIASGMLKPLPLAQGAERFVEMYLVFRERDAAGPGTLRLAQIIAETVAEGCRAHAGADRARRAARPSR
jgi:DNA-binding transcriptional LysR family regulator